MSINAIGHSSMLMGAYFPANQMGAHQTTANTSSQQEGTAVEESTESPSARAAEVGKGGVIDTFA